MCNILLEKLALRAINKVFPKIPVMEKTRITNRVLYRIAKNPSFEGSLEEKISSIAVAYVRHRYTNYDNLIKENLLNHSHFKYMVRKEVNTKVKSILDSWR